MTAKSQFGHVMNHDKPTIVTVCQDCGEIDKTTPIMGNDAELKAASQDFEYSHVCKARFLYFIQYKNKDTRYGNHTCMALDHSEYLQSFSLKERKAMELGEHDSWHLISAVRA